MIIETDLSTEKLDSTIEVIRTILSSIKKVTEHQSSVELPSDTNCHLLPLNSNWTFGRNPKFNNRNDYSPKTIFTFSNIGMMWQVLNNVFVIPEFVMKSHNIDEIWFFRHGYIPNTSELVNKPTEISIIVPSKGLVLYLLMIIFGETLLQNCNDMEKIIGMRIKPSKLGGDIRFWVIDTKIVEPVTDALKIVVGEWKEKCTVSSKLLNY
jgi:hypothetical protein